MTDDDAGETPMHSADFVFHYDQTGAGRRYDFGVIGPPLRLDTEQRGDGVERRSKPIEIADCEIPFRMTQDRQP